MKFTVRHINALVNATIITSIIVVVVGTFLAFAAYASIP